jgi:hypothetical protein
MVQTKETASHHPCQSRDTILIALPIPRLPLLAQPTPILPNHPIAGLEATTRTNEVKMPTIK